MSREDAGRARAVLYNWESRKARSHQDQILKLSQLLKVVKREVMAFLGAEHTGEDGYAVIGARPFATAESHG